MSEGPAAVALGRTGMGLGTRRTYSGHHIGHRYMLGSMGRTPDPPLWSWLEGGYVGLPPQPSMLGRYAVQVGVGEQWSGQANAILTGDNRAGPSPLSLQLTQLDSST